MRASVQPQTHVCALNRNYWVAVHYPAEHRERPYYLVEGQGLRHRRCGRDHSLGSRFLPLGRGDPGRDHVRRDAGFETVEVTRDPAVAVGHRGPGTRHRRVLAVRRGVCVHHLLGRRSDLVRREDLREPSVDVRQQAVLSHRKARRVVVYGQGVIVGPVTAVEGVARTMPPCSLLPQESQVAKPASG